MVGRSEVSSKEKISVRKDGPFCIVEFLQPGVLNAFTGEDYIYLGELLDGIDRDGSVFFTVLQSSGRFFSAGADFRRLSQESKEKYSSETAKWVRTFLATNVFVTDMFVRHSKVLICCLNGPVIGMSAALVALCDIVYAMNDKVYLLYPFASLGLITEGGTSITLPLKLGLNTTFESLMFSKPFTFDQLSSTGFINKNYKLDNTDEFNTKVMQDLKKKTEGLYLPSCTGMKKLIRENYMSKLQGINSVEANSAVKNWVDGIPTQRFTEISKGQRSHKL